MSAARKRPRVLFFHSEVRSYRVPLFELLNERFDVQFIFLHQTHYSLKTPEAKRWHYTYLKPIKLPGYSADACPGIISYLVKNRSKYDVVIFSGIFSFATHVGVPLAKLLGKRVVIWDETWVIPHNFGSRIIYPYLKLLVRSANALVEAGTKTHQLYLKMGAKESKCFRAPNCAEDIIPLIEKGLSSRLLEKSGLTKNQIIIGYLGRIVRYKALDVLLESFYTHIRPRFPEARLLIVGDGPFRLECQAIISRYGSKHVVWVGGEPGQIEPVSHEEFVNYLSLIDVFVLPGRFVWQDNVPAESWGLTLNEAMSLGKPVISTTSVAAAYDLIENKNNGYLVKEDSVGELSGALEKVVGDASFRQQAGEKSKKIIDQKFNYQKMFHGFERAINYVRNG